MTRAVELVSTGSELLSGRTLNRHAQVLGDHLHELGLKLLRDTTVPDDIDLIQEAIESALRRVDIVLVSGGLGPTSDDVTREAIAKMLGRTIVMDEPSVEALRQRFRRMGRAVTEQGERQARVVEGAAALSNSVGAAPGERIELDKKVIFVLPGPPREFLAVLEEHVIPWLKKNLDPIAKPAERMFLVCGLGESDIVLRFETAGFPPDGLDVAYSAAPGRVEIRIAAPPEKGKLVEDSGSEIRRLLGDNIFSEQPLEMEEVIGRLLVQQKATLATAESCTGGLIGHRVTTVSGSSNYYLGGVIAYSNDVKIRELGVSGETLKQFGAVSEAVAREMAVGVRQRCESDFGLAVTGIAGPTGGTPEKPVGLVFIALADRHTSWVKRIQFPGTRPWIKEWASQMALDLLRRRLIGVLKD